MFITEYIRHPRTVGAVAPSGKRLARSMMKPIDFDSCSCIVEYGAGTGAFTAELIKRREITTKLLVIEKNSHFYEILREKFGDIPGVYIINGDVLDLRKYMEEYGIESVDYIISGLPFASLPSYVSDNILSHTKEILAESDGKFITFQYTLFKKSLFSKFFEIEKINWTFQNIPSAFVLTMS